MRTILPIMAAVFVFANATRADIFQWEYINPADSSQGKQQSTTLAPDGAGVDAVPGTNLSIRNLTMAYLIGADLTNAYGYRTNLTDADLSQANLTNAYFAGATLTGADFTNAEVRGAYFGLITLAQLYSTASYAAHDLSGIGLSSNNLSGANLSQVNLSNSSFTFADLTNANLSQSNLTGAYLDGANLSGADFTNAEVRGASFGHNIYLIYSPPPGAGITLAQLYSTASYAAHDLSGIRLRNNDLSGANFAGQNLTNASFRYAALTGADFTGAEVQGANFGWTTYYGFTAAQLYSTASYQAHDLTGIHFRDNDLSGWNFAGQNLTTASFDGATLTDANFTGAVVRRANFAREVDIYGYATVYGITLAQLYSTASYQTYDLAGIYLAGNDLTGGNFAHQNLTNASFGRRWLNDEEDYADEVLYATLIGTDFTGADTRGAAYFHLSSATTTNLIRPNGHIDGLDLDPGALLVVRDYDGFPGEYEYPSYRDPIPRYRDPIPPLPIKIDQHMAMAPGGTLRMVFEADAWDSTISFAPGIPVTLGGTLELTFADNVNLASQLGRTFDLFNWTGVNPTGAFAISSPYAWDLSNLYTTGEITLAAIPEPTSFMLLAVAAMFVARRKRLCAGFLLSLSPLLLVSPSPAQADIFQWEYINPADPSQGKRQSTTLAPGGAGVDAVPGAILANRNLTMAYLAGRNLEGAVFGFYSPYYCNFYTCQLPAARVASADFTGADLRGANFNGADLNDVNVTGADIRGASFNEAFDNLYAEIIVGGLTLAQLYSTASYQAHDLSGVGLRFNNLSGANFAGQNLTNADFRWATLTGADFAGQNLTNGNFGGANLAGANLREANLANANFVGQCWPPDPNSGCFPYDATFTGADLTAADARGASGLNVSAATTTKLIRPDGHIYDLDLDAGGMLLVRDHDGDSARTDIYGTPTPIPPTPITIDQHLTMGPGGTLRMVFEADAWDSTISFAPGIPVTLGGTLELTFADNVNLASQVGRTFDLFNWTGTNPTGAFAVFSPYAWDLSNLYTTGQVTLTAIPEPTTFALISLGLIGLVVRIRRRPLSIYSNGNKEESHAESQRRGGVGIGRSPLRPLRLRVSLFSIVVFASAAHADIFQWEYINPADPSQGKQQSTMLCFDGAGVDPVPSASLSNRNLTMAYLVGADLANAYGYQANLTDADLSQANLTSAIFQSATLTGADLRTANLTGTNFNQANVTGANFAGQNLTNANFSYATLTNADFTGAEVRRAHFDLDPYTGYGGTGITLTQLYATASYQAHDLSGISLGFNNLAGANFAGQNFSNAYFYSATLTDADFREANLTNAYFAIATLTDADFTGAEVRGADFFNVYATGITLAQLYSTASYQAHDLSGIRLHWNNLAGANFAGQNLTNANFVGATLTDADFTNAEVLGASFSVGGIGLTTAQLYSTASYRAHDLTGIGLGGDLTGWNFAGQNLTNASFYQDTLTGADFSGAEIRGANFGRLRPHSCCRFPTGLTLAQLYSTASYQAHDLSGVGLFENDLVGGMLAGQNLRDANFDGADLTNADLTGADIRGASFNVTIDDAFFEYLYGGLTLAQLYSTASYQTFELAGINLGGNDLTGGNFAHQNLTNSSFGPACYASGNIGCFWSYWEIKASLSGTDFTGADARGAQYLEYLDDWGFTTTTNLIRPDGHISGIDLDAGALLVVRDYDGDPARTDIYGTPTPIPPTPITIDQHLTMGPGGTLRMVFEADAWDSTISFAPGIPVTLGGTLELTFADNVNLASQVGRTFDLFNWTGTNPTGAFAVFSPYAWDLSNLYTTGQVTLTAIPEPCSLILLAVVASATITSRRFALLGGRTEHHSLNNRGAC